MNELDKVFASQNVPNDPTQKWEAIIKYHGDIERIATLTNSEVDILNENYAIFTNYVEELRKLAFFSEIEYIEIPKELTLLFDNSNISKKRISKNKYDFEDKVTPKKNKELVTSQKVENSLMKDLTGKGVLVAIIDSGINFKHEAFITSKNTSRIAYMWDQTQSQEGFSPPKGFDRGTEYSQEEITRAIKGEIEINEIDFVGHGTAVAGVAAGNSSFFKGVAPECELLIVKLGETGSELFSKTTRLMRAIQYVQEKAIELDKPLVINISFGTNNGSHDGKSLFETYIDDMASKWKTSIVIPTGNDGNSEHHFFSIVKENETTSIKFSVSEGNPKFFATLWKSFTDIMTFEVITPEGYRTGEINYSNPNSSYMLSKNLVEIVYGEPSPYNVSQEIYFNFSALDGENISSGIWTINVYPQAIVQGNVDVWLPVNEIVTRSTKFLNADPNTTLTIPSTSVRVISVAGYNSNFGNITFFSGKGYDRNSLIKPDIAAPAEEVESCDAFGGYDVFTGTSFSAPAVAGACALLMQWGIVEQNDLFMYGERLKAYLQLGATRKTTLSYPNKDFGFGTLSIDETLRYLSLRQNTFFNKQKFNLLFTNAEKNNINEILNSKKTENTEINNNANETISNSNDFNLNENLNDFNLNDNSNDFNLNDNSNDFNLNDNSNDFNLNDNSNDFNLNDNSNDFNLNNNSNDFNLNNNSNDFNSNDNSNDFNLNDNLKLNSSEILMQPTQEEKVTVKATLIDLPPEELVIDDINIDENEINKDPIVSNNYIDFLVLYDITSRFLLDKIEYAKVCTVIAEKYAVVSVPVDKISEFRQATFDLPIEFPMVLSTTQDDALSSAGIYQILSSQAVSLDGSDVLIGIIDTGINYNLENFIYEDGTTKIKSIWDQTIEGNAPNGFCYGTEYSENEINLALSSENPQSVVPHSDENGHGTFLASISASVDLGSFTGAAPRSDLIVVKLKDAKQIYVDQELINNVEAPKYQSTDVLLAIEYLQRQSNALRKPIAICIGLATNSGSHDGRTLFEDCISTLSIKAGTAINISAGNEGLERTHFLGNINKTGETLDLEINVAQGEEGFVLRIWNEFVDKVSISIKSPTGAYINRLPLVNKKIYKENFVFEKTQVIVEYQTSFTISNSQRTLVRLKNPTAGIWTITLHGDFIVNGEIHAWLPMRNFLKRDTVFIKPNNNYTLTTPSTSLAAIAVGAYDSHKSSIYPNSSIGPSRKNSITLDFVAPGVYVEGFYPTGKGAMSGSSVAAAISTGASALMLQWGVVNNNDIRMNTISIRSYLIRGCTRKDNLSYPNVEWGYGTLNLLQSFLEMESKPYLL